MLLLGFQAIATMKKDYSILENMFSSLEPMLEFGK